jgi:hypothetical protein
MMMRLDFVDAGGVRAADGSTARKSPTKNRATQAICLKPPKQQEPILPPRWAQFVARWKQTASICTRFTSPTLPTFPQLPSTTRPPSIPSYGSFDAEGKGVVFNDEAVGTNLDRSRIDNSTGCLTGRSAGVYYIAISRYNRDAIGCGG